MYRQLKRSPKRYGALWFLAGLFVGALYGSRGRHQRGAAPPPPPEFPDRGMDIEADVPGMGQVEIGVSLAGWREQDDLIAAFLRETGEEAYIPLEEAAASEMRETLNHTHIAVRSLSSAPVWIEKPAGYLLDDDLNPVPYFDAELIERAWRDESRRVRISYLDDSYELVRYPEDASYVLSTVFLPKPLYTEDGTAKFFATRLFRKVVPTLNLVLSTASYRVNFLTPVAPEGFVWFPVLDAGRPVYSSYDDAAEGHLRVLEELAEEGV